MSVPPIPRHGFITALFRAAMRLRHATAGASALEFAILAPILCVMLAGTYDFGLVVYMRLTLNRDVSAATDYVLVDPARVSSASGASLAADMASILPAGEDISIVINNGPALQRTAGVTTNSGTAGAADYCYCPQLGDGALTWGRPLACGATCSDGVAAGQYVVVMAHEAYAPMLGVLDGLSNGTIAVQSVARVR